MANSDKPLRYDPLPVYCFKVVLDGVPGHDAATAFFKSVGGIKSETEVVDVKVGGRNDATVKLPGPNKWSNIVLKRGFSKGKDSFSLLKWRDGWIKEDPKGRIRVSGKITQLDTAMQPVCTWSFVRGWPCKWEVAEFDASKNELAIETLEIAHEGLTFSEG